MELFQTNTALLRFVHGGRGLTRREEMRREERERERDAFPFNCKSKRSKEALSAIDLLSQALNASPARGWV